MKIRICHLYPELLNLYGDRGNVLSLWRRAVWRGIEAEIIPVTLSDRAHFTDFDLIFWGGGADREQELVSQDLPLKADSLKEAVEEGVALLAVCGGFQLLGLYYRLADGKEIPGAGVFNIYTVAGTRRLRGNALVSCNFLPGWPELVGFENHSGRTYLEGTPALGMVRSGYGNNGEDSTEGAFYHNAIGTYLHGPLLPKNPLLADFLLERALSRRYGKIDLPPLDDRLERLAHASARRRTLGWRVWKKRR